HRAWCPLAGAVPGFVQLDVCAANAATTAVLTSTVAAQTPTGFLRRSQSDLKAELFLPTTLSELNERREISIDLLKSDDAWFGITYRDDLPTAQTAIRELITAGRYPTPLWG
ncbi:MAG: hypothetical protein ACYC8T_27765, partial [Myxococcaceae bacterium]